MPPFLSRRLRCNDIEREVLKDIAAAQASQGDARKRSVPVAASAPHGLDVVLDYFTLSASQPQTPPLKRVIEKKRRPRPAGAVRLARPELVLEEPRHQGGE